MFEDRPQPEPCLRHSLVGRGHDPGCYACERDRLEAVAAWKQRQVIAFRVLTVESIFGGTA